MLRGEALPFKLFFELFGTMVGCPLVGVCLYETIFAFFYFL